MAGFDLNRMPKGANALWFFVALFGGGAAIWWTKSVSEDAWIAAAVAAGVVLLLTVYYVLNNENAPEEEGDNVYYLGLLYTLLSLMFALVELFGSGSGAARDPDNIHTLLEHFGIALTSTVVGIAGRVAVQNWQRAGFAAEPDLTPRPAGPGAGCRRKPGRPCRVQSTSPRHDRSRSHTGRKRTGAISQNCPKPCERQRGVSAQP